MGEAGSLFETAPLIYNMKFFVILNISPVTYPSIHSNTSYNRLYHADA